MSGDNIKVCNVLNRHAFDLYAWNLLKASVVGSALLFDHTTYFFYDLEVERSRRLTSWDLNTKTHRHLELVIKILPRIQKILPKQYKNIKIIGWPKFLVYFPSGLDVISQSIRVHYFRHIDG